MAIFKDYLIKGLYYVENGASNCELWTEMMISECGERMKPHLHYIMLFSFTMAYLRAGTNEKLKRNLSKELKKIKKICKRQAR